MLWSSKQVWCRTDGALVTACPPGVAGLAVPMLMLLAFVSCPVGCGRSSGIVKVEVAGEVRYDGQPITNGDIAFYPIPGTKGPVSGAAIKDGHYVVTNKGGVPVGQHMVQVRGFQVGDPAGANADLLTVAKTPQRPDRGQFLPDKYNKATTLRVEVDEDTETLNFDLEK